MTIAVRNARAHIGSYGAYLGSFALTVTVFFLYAALLAVAGPQLASQHEQEGLQACGVVILVFACVFTYYAHGAFLRTRAQEFGLLQLLGMTRRQITLVTAGELLLLSLLALVGGLAVATVTEKLFFLLATVPLSLGTVPHWAWTAKPYWQTITVFAALSVVLALWAGWHVARLPVWTLLRLRRQARRAPRLSRVRVVLAVLCLATAWGLALDTGIAALSPLRVLIILVGAMVGTYLTFSQGSVALLRLLQRQHSFYYQGLRMAAIGQLVFRSRDHARLLALASLLGAVVLVALGSIFAVYARAEALTRQNWPYAVSYSTAKNAPDRSSFIVRRLAALGHPVTFSARATGISVTSRSGQWYFIVSADTFARLAQAVGQRSSWTVPPGHAIWDYPWTGYVNLGVSPTSPPVRLQVGAHQVVLTIDHSTNLRVIDALALVPQYLIVNPLTYKELLHMAPLSDQWQIYSWQIRDWKSSQRTTQAIADELQAFPDANAADWTAAAPYYQEMLQELGSVLFVGMFIGLIFLLGLGSIQYFRIVTELREDRQQFTALWRLGVSNDMNRRVMAAQVVALFAAPCVMAVANGTVAFLLLARLLDLSLWGPALLSVVVYLGVTSVFLLVALGSQLHSLPSDRRPGGWAT